MTGDEGLTAVLYVDSLDPHFCTAQDLERLAKFSRIIAKAVGDNAGAAVERAPSRAEAWESYLERTPVEDMEREKLLLLLNRNEWNIARVARLMGVTRRTIYLRLQRYNIPRERVAEDAPAAGGGAARQDYQVRGGTRAPPRWALANPPETPLATRRRCAAPPCSAVGLPSLLCPPAPPSCPSPSP